MFARKSTAFKIARQTYMANGSARHVRFITSMSLTVTATLLVQYKYRGSHLEIPSTTSFCSLCFLV